MKIYLSIFLMFLVSICRAQTIPNFSFEIWTNMGSYNNPESWGCLNDLTSSTSVYTCEKGTPGNPGAAYIKLTSKVVAGMGVVPGIAVSGILNQSTMLPESGFAFNLRPSVLTGSWQHMIFGNSQGFIDVQLTRWNGTRIPVAAAHYVLTGMAMNWANFSIPLTYVDGNYPDSCIITLSASGNNPSDYDYLYVDNLSFSGTVVGVSNVFPVNSIGVYPNPSTSKIMIDLSNFFNTKIDILITDIQGKTIKSIICNEANTSMSIDIEDFPKGNYILKVTSVKEVLVSHFIKQ